MRVLSGLFLAAAAGLTVAGWTAPAWAAPLQASSKWGVDFGEAHCIAYRSFDTAGKPLRLIVKAPVLGDDLQVSISTEGRTGGHYDEQLRGTWRIDDGPQVKVTVLAFRPEKNINHVLMMNLPRSSLARLIAKPGTMSLTISSKLSHTMRIEGLGAAMKVVDECVAGMRKDWNVTNEIVADYAAFLAAPPKKWTAPAEPIDGSKRAKTDSLARYFSSSDYPSTALADGDDGIVRFVMLIDEKGRVADCTLTKTSGVAVLDAQTCAVVRERARFKPALDSAGKARRDVGTTRVSWQLSP